MDEVAEVIVGFMPVVAVAIALFVPSRWGRAVAFLLLTVSATIAGISFWDEDTEQRNLLTWKPAAMLLLHLALLVALRPDREPLLGRSRRAPRGESAWSGAGAAAPAAWGAPAPSVPPTAYPPQQPPSPPSRPG